MMETDWSEWIRSGGWAREEEATIPVLPSHVAELVQMAFEPDVPVRRITSVVATEPVLAMQVVRMANSAFSAPASRITNIGEAVTRLGTEMVRNVVIAGCLNARLADPHVYGPQGRHIVDHCVGTAFLASLLAEPYGASGELFLGGLLHDVGKLLILKLAHDFRRRSPNGPTDEAVEAVMVDRHPQIGGWLAGRWNMPVTVADPIVWHHAPEWAEGNRSVAIVSAANRLAHRYGFGCEKDPADLLEDPVLLTAGIDAVQLASLDSRAQAIYDTARHVMATG